MRITPQIERNDIVRSHIEVEVSSVDPSFSAPSGPSLKTRRAATEFNVRSGQTLVLAGFVSRETALNTDSLPGLSQLPILGHLFKTRRFQRSETELAIFVTPVVVSADHPDLVRRVTKGQAILKDNFPNEERLNVPVRADVTLPTILLPDGDQKTSWNPWEGKGSQWSTPSRDTSHLADITKE